MNKKFVVSYVLDYVHQVSVGVEAESQAIAIQIAEQAYTKKQESSKINLYPELLKLEFLHKLVSDSLYVQQVEECKNYHLEGDSHELREKINKLTDSYQMLFARDLKRYDKCNTLISY